MTAKTEARDRAPGDLAALDLDLLQRLYRDGTGVGSSIQQQADFDEAIHNDFPALLALARSAEAAEGLSGKLSSIADGIRQQVDATRHYGRISCGDQSTLEISTSHFLDLATEVDALLSALDKDQPHAG